MKSVQINSYGEPEVIQVNPDAPKPSLKEGQVLVEVLAASINAIDWKLSKGFLQKTTPLVFPFTLGGDFAGVIKETTIGAEGFMPGDEVYGSAIVLGGGSGAMAEYAAANSRNIALKPKPVGFNEASGLPLVGSSAVQAIEEHIKLQKGQKILIHGGAGGIGHIAIQLAKLIGAHTATTVKTDDFDFVKRLGADEVIDYKSQKFEEILKDYDAVYDTVGNETTIKSFNVLKRGGILVSMLGQPDQELANKYGVTAIGQETKTNTAHLKRLAELVEGGKIKVNVDKTYPLELASEAFAYQEKIHPRGKVVIKIK